MSPATSFPRLMASLALLFASAGCGSSTTTFVNPSPVEKCQVAITGGQVAMDAAGGAGTVTVSAAIECGWTATTSANWITGLSPASGQGGGEVKFQVTPNPTTGARQADISLNGAIAKVTQSGRACTIEIAPRDQTLAASGGSGTVTVTTLSGCQWSAVSNASWLTVQAGTGRNGPGALSFSAEANTGPTRTATLTIGDQAMVVTQLAADAPGPGPSPVPTPVPGPSPTPCSYTVQPGATSINAAGGPIAITVQAGAGCSWTATSNTQWLTVGGSGAGSGAGSFTITAAVNSGAGRAGTVSIGGQTVTVTQAGACVSTISSASQAVPAAGGAATPVTVTSTAGCAWTATSTTPWISITSGATGAGNGTVAFTVAANTGPARSGTIAIAGATHTVNQASGCSISINPTSASSPASGGPGASIAVAAGTGCTWTATSAATWITITSGTPGTGAGSVGYTVAANGGDARTGTISIASNTFTVSQAAACAYAISPTSQKVSKNAEAGDPISVTTSAGCAWTATSNDSWITIETGAKGTGSGTVTFSVSRNDGSARTGTLTIAGKTFTVTQDKR